MGTSCQKDPAFIESLAVAAHPLQSRSGISAVCRVGGSDLWLIFKPSPIPNRKSDKLVAGKFASGLLTCDECGVISSNQGVEEIEVEVVPPESQTQGQRTNFTSLLAWVLDDLFLIPGTKFRIGLDPLIGLVPGVGDTSTAALGSVILIRALQAGVPRIVIARMAAHLLLNALVGAIPGVGDVFSAWFKSNRRNHDLLKKHLVSGSRRASTTGDWVFLFGLMGIVLGVTVGAALVAGYLAWRILGVLFGWS